MPKPKPKPSPNPQPHLHPGQAEAEERSESDASAAERLAELQLENARLVAMARMREEGLSTQVGELQPLTLTLTLP